MNTNQRAIAPVTIWLNGVTSTATMLSLDGYSGYNFIDSPGQVHYNLLDADGNMVLSGVTTLDWATVENWGSDDQPVFVYVAGELNITLL
jgi:hypothetical protein